MTCIYSLRLLGQSPGECLVGSPFVIAHITVAATILSPNIFQIHLFFFIVFAVTGLFQDYNSFIVGWFFTLKSALFWLVGVWRMMCTIGLKWPQNPYTCILLMVENSVSCHLWIYWYLYTSNNPSKSHSMPNRLKTSRLLPSALCISAKRTAKWHEISFCHNIIWQYTRHQPPFLG